MCFGVTSMEYVVMSYKYGMWSVEAVLLQKLAL